MKQTYWSISDLYPQSKPLLEFHDNGTKEELYILSIGPNIIGLLN
jgi:hypothetical protein